MSGPSPEEVADLVTRPKLNPSFVPVAVDRNEVHFRAGPWSGPVFTIADEDGDGEVTALVDRLDGTATTEEILSDVAPSARSTVAEVVRALQERRIVYEAADGVGTDRDSTPMPRGFTHADAAALDGASTLVVGPGRMTSPAVTDLLRTDADAVLVLEPGADDPDSTFDDDRVERVGRDDLDASVADVDLAATFLDRPAPDLLDEVNRVVHDRETAWLLARTCGYDGVVGPLVVPGESACYECFRRRRDANLPAADEYAAFEDAASGRAGSPGPDVAAFERVVAGLATVDALNYLSYGFGFTVGRVVHYDFSVFSMECNDVLPVPRCPVCGTGPRVDANRFFTLDGLVEDLDRGGRD